MNFCADRFSQFGPEWVELEHGNDDFVRNLVFCVNNRYSHLVGKVSKVFKVSGLEINSSNFLVEGNVGRIVIKLLGKAEYSLFQAQKSIYDHIKSSCLPAPCVIGSGVDTGNIGSAHLVLEYVEGSYFSGSNSDLSLTSVAINSLHDGFHDFRLAKFPELEIFQNNSQSVLSEFLETKNEWQSKFGMELADLLRENIDLMVNAEMMCRKNLETITRIEKSIFHIDLHPHNIIVGPNRASIIDLDSLKVSRWPTALGFCYFKLAKQVIVKQGIKNVDFNKLNEFAEAITHRVICNSNKLDLLLLGALTEVTRRLLIILQGNLGSSISPWNSVLSIQVNAISEIRALQVNSL